MNCKHPIVLLAFVSLTFTSCEEDCFDQELQDQFQNIICTADCPGVTGCDGKTYCNACVAGAQGIRVE